MNKNREETGRVDEKVDFVNEIDALAEQVKVMALNLAINLARAKNEASELAFMEPDFTRLINGSVEVIKEITGLIRVARNEEKRVYTPPSRSDQLDRIENSLNDIAELSQNILGVIATIKKGKNQVDNIK